MGAPVSAPVSRRFDPDPHLRPDRAPRVREGLVRSISPCHSITSGWRPSSSVPSPSRATRNPPPSRPRRSRSCSPVATCSPAPRPAPARRPPSCCPCSSCSTRRGPAGPRAIRALILTPTRELALQVEESVRTYGAPEPDPVHHHLRRRRLRSAGPRAARRAGDRGRHPRPPARPPRPAHDRPVAGRDPRPRRGRPDARHGLHPRHPQDPRGPAAATPEPALLGDLLGRDPAARRRAARRPGVRPGHAAQHAHRARDPGRPHGRPRAEARAAQPPHHDRPDRPGARLHPDQARRQPARPAARARRDRWPPRSTATRASRSASARWPTSRRAGSRSSSRPRWRPAASTSRRSRTWSTSSCRWSPRTTSTGSAGPAGPASTATPSRWSASTSSSSSTTSSACSVAASRARRSRASSPIRASDPSRSCGAVSAARGHRRSMSGAGAPRHGGGAASRRRSATGWRPHRPARPATGRELRQAAPALRDTARGPRPGSGSRPGGSRPGNRGAGFAGPRRPGQGIGNGAGSASGLGWSATRSPDGGDGPRDPTVAAAATASHARRMQARSCPVSVSPATAVVRSSSHAGLRERLGPAVRSTPRAGTRKARSDRAPRASRRAVEVATPGCAASRSGLARACRGPCPCRGSWPRTCRAARSDPSWPPR